MFGIGRWLCFDLRRVSGLSVNFLCFPRKNTNRYSFGAANLTVRCFNPGYF